jgi:hypothetical protein
MVAEQDVFVGGVIVLTVSELVRRSRALRIEHRDFGGKKCSIIAISQRKKAEREREDEKRVHGVT